MQINFFQNIKNANISPKIGEKRSYSVPVAFCGVDVFEKSAVKFSKKLCIDTASKLIKDENSLEAWETVQMMKGSDSGQIKLDKLAAKYKESLSFEDKKTLSLENKKNLLKHEEKMHWQEMKTPEIGLTRVMDDMLNAGIGSDFIPAMNISTLIGLSRIKQAYDALGLKFEPDKRHFNLLKNLIKNTPDDYPFAPKIKRFAVYLAESVKKDDADFIKLAKYTKENTNDEGLKILANTKINDCSKYNEGKLLSKLSGGELKVFEKIDVIKTLAKNKSKKMTELLPAMIKDKNVPSETKITAVWAAGRCQSKENFDLLHEIANNKSSKNLEEREMAIHSLALYLRSDENQVKQTLKNVINEKSDLSELASVLLEKTEGRYHVKDKELVNLTEKEKSQYKEMRDKYVETDFKVNIQQTNVLDRAFAPLKKALANIADNDLKMYIMDDTYTKVSRGKIGTRYFTQDPEYGGRFGDSATGVSSQNLIFINKKLLNSPTKLNAAAHEFDHTFLHSCLSKKDNAILSSLYKEAVKQDKCLDNYAKLSKAEYFAQGYEAHQSVYKPHSAIIENNNFNEPTCHVRSTLKRKDLDLYKFIEYCIKKYNS